MSGREGDLLCGLDAEMDYIDLEVLLWVIGVREWRERTFHRF